MIKQGIILSMILLLLFVAAAFLVIKSLYDQSAALEIKVGTVEKQAAEARAVVAQSDAMIQKLRKDLDVAQKRIQELKKEVDKSNLPAQVASLLRSQQGLSARMERLEKKWLQGPRTLAGGVEPDTTDPTGVKIRVQFPENAFEARRLSKGTYRILFKTPFQSTPAVVLTQVLKFDARAAPGGDTRQYAFVREVTPRYADVTMGIYEGPGKVGQPGKDGQPSDRAFSFIAIGTPE